jgi:hypothetical protein
MSGIGTHSSGEITLLLLRMAGGDTQASEKLLRLVLLFAGLGPAPDVHCLAVSLANGTHKQVFKLLAKEPCV